MNAPSQPSRPLLRAERVQDAAAVEALVDRAFGPGRLTKASERVREFATFRPDLSFCAWDGDRLAGAVRQWTVRAGDLPVVFLGPLAVDENQRLGGLGARLVEQACEAAQAAGYPAVVLVGDAPYFARFGFSAAPTAGLVMPSPVDQRRVLARLLNGRAANLEGRLRA